MSIPNGPGSLLIENRLQKVGPVYVRRDDLPWLRTLSVTPERGVSKGHLALPLPFSASQDIFTHVCLSFVLFVLILTPNQSTRDSLKVTLRSLSEASSHTTCFFFPSTLHRRLFSRFVSHQNGAKFPSRRS